MREYVTEAVVLKKEPVREFDARVSLYTKELGKVSAVVTSARKPLSKLSPHLEPLSMVEVRLAEKGGMHLTDALRRGALPTSSLPILPLLDAMLAVGERDDRLWSVIAGGQTGVYEILSVLGFDPAFALCDACGAPSPSTFLFHDAQYFCERCLPQGFPRGEYVRLPPHQTSR